MSWYQENQGQVLQSYIHATAVLIHTSAQPKKQASGSASISRTRSLMRSLDDSHTRDARIFNFKCLMLNDRHCQFNTHHSTFIMCAETPSRLARQLPANPSLVSPLQPDDVATTWHIRSPAHYSASRPTGSPKSSSRCTLRGVMHFRRSSSR